MDDIVQKALKKQFDAHLADPNAPIHRESDSDTAPVAAIVDEREETDEERKARHDYNVDESARLASSEDEEGHKIRGDIRGRPPKVQTAAAASEAKAQSSESSGEDEEWFAAQRKNARRPGGATRPQTAASAQAEALKKQKERQAMMLKLKK